MFYLRTITFFFQNFSNLLCSTETSKWYGNWSFYHMETYGESWGIMGELWRIMGNYGDLCVNYGGIMEELWRIMGSYGELWRKYGELWENYR